MVLRDLPGKAARRVACFRARLAARRPEMSRRRDDRTGLDYTRIRSAASTRELRRQWRRAGWSASRRNPELLVLAPGVYEIHLRGIDGLDVVGAIGDRDVVRLTHGGPHDTLNLSGCSTSWCWVTVSNTSPVSRYAIHVDGPGDGAEVTLLEVTAHSRMKGALGLGLFGGQGVWADRCTFERGSPEARSPAAVLVHNWHDQDAPCVASFTDCTATATHSGVAFKFVDIGSGQPDTVTWSGGSLSGPDGDRHTELRPGSTVLIDVTAPQPRRRPM